MRTLFRMIPLLVLGLVVFSGCSSDDNNDTTPPATGTLSGNVIFHGQWPDSGTVQLSVFDNWSTSPCSWCGQAPGGPPAYYTPASYFVDPNPNNGDGPDTVAFTISGITLGQYASIAVGWRAPHVNSINCDEPTIGLYGAEWGTTDSIPEVVTFSTDHTALNVNVNAYFEMLPIPGCNERGRIEGVARVSGDWPASGLLVMLTTFPVSGWNPVMGQPTAYYIMSTAADSLFRFDPPFGTYYLSIWTNAQPPAPSQWYGSYGIDTYLRSGHPVGTDPHPDAIVLNAGTPATGGLVVPGNSPAPHYVSGHVNFTGTRPAEGLLVMLTTQPVSPEQPPTSQPFGYFAITDPTETLYAICGMPAGTYYVSLWNNVQGPGSVCYGAYGYTAGSDPNPDPLTLDDTTWGVTGKDVSGHP
jgi:hypothetical protein